MCREVCDALTSTHPTLRFSMHAAYSTLLIADFDERAVLIHHKAGTGPVPSPVAMALAMGLAMGPMGANAMQPGGSARSGGAAAPSFASMAPTPPQMYGQSGPFESRKDSAALAAVQHPATQWWQNEDTII